MYYNLQAIILKRQVFKDDDLLISLYSKEKGKLVLQAKGAKKILSKLAGHLEPLTLSNLNVTFGKNIDQLIGAQSIKTYQPLKNNIKTLAYANYFTELVNELTHQDHADQYIFNLLNKSLNYLEQHNNYVLARISFGFKLLYLLGFNPATKSSPKLETHINYIIKNNLDNIQKNSDIISNLAQLNKILDQELEEHLAKELHSKEFLKQLYV